MSNIIHRWPYGTVLKRAPIVSAGRPNEYRAMVVRDDQERLRLLNLTRMDAWLDTEGLEFYSVGNIIDWVIDRKWLARAEDT